MPRKSTRSTSGTSQTKCRLIRYSRLVGAMPRHRTLVPTSSQPAVRPHHADSASTSRGRGRPVPAETAVRSSDLVTFSSHGLPS